MPDGDTKVPNFEPDLFHEAEILLACLRVGNLTETDPEITQQ